MAHRTIAILLVLGLVAPVMPQQPKAAEPAEESALKIIVKEGEGALNNVVTLRAKEPVVLVTDLNDQPIPGAAVMFLAPEIGPSVVFPNGNSLMVTTDEHGVAVGSGMRTNNQAGAVEIRVVASHQGQTARVVVHQTNAAPKAASSSGGGRKTAVLLAVLGGAGAAVAVGVTRGGNKSGSAAATPGTSISAGGTTFGPPR